MRIKALVKNLVEEKNPLVCRHRNAMRKQLQNKTPTFLCPNCIGGILFHDLGIQFCSPTVNNMMLQTDFVKFVLNMEYYLRQPLAFFDHPEHEFPCVLLDDVTVYFTHYKTREEAQEKWTARCKRMDKDNLFVFLMERDGLTEQQIRELSQLNVRGLVVFTANDYPDIPYALQLPRYAKDKEVGNVLRKSYLNGRREYEKYFDFIKWFNEANGAPYDISCFKR